MKIEQSSSKRSKPRHIKTEQFSSGRRKQITNLRKERKLRLQGLEIMNCHKSKL
jgi:hypothetical protein